MSAGSLINGQTASLDSDLWLVRCEGLTVGGWYVCGPELYPFGFELVGLHDPLVALAAGHPAVPYPEPGVLTRLPPSPPRPADDARHEDSRPCTVSILAKRHADGTGVQVAPVRFFIFSSPFPLSSSPWTCSRTASAPSPRPYRTFSIPPRRKESAKKYPAEYTT